MVGFIPDMKSNLLAYKSTNIDAQLATHNDFLQVVITSKMEEEFVDLLQEVNDILEEDYVYENEDEFMDDSSSFYLDKLKDEPGVDFNSNSLLHAGYSDCMEEAIRFLVEEENLSPEHPIVKNLKSHLEKSKDRILETYSNPEVQSSSGGLSDFFFETFQKCRDSG